MSSNSGRLFNSILQIISIIFIIFIIIFVSLFFYVTAPPDFSLYFNQTLIDSSVLQIYSFM